MDDPEEVARRVAVLDDEIRRVAEQLRGRDDGDEFAAGLDRQQIDDLLDERHLLAPGPAVE